MKDNKLFESILQNAYNISGKFVSKHEDKQDLAQIVAMKFFLNKDSIDLEKKDNWIYTTTKNASIDFLKSRKDVSEKAVNFDKIENQITEKLLNTDEIDETESLLKQFEKDLSKPERELLALYAKESFQIKKIAKRKRSSYEAIKKKIYRLKADIRAKHNLQKGMIGSRKIFGAKLNENLLNFFSKFIKALETNTLDKMSIYFRDCEIPNQYPDFKISKIIEYDVRLDRDDVYVIFLYYYDPDEQVKTVITWIQVYNENAIKIIKFPHQPSFVKEIDPNDLPPEVLEMLEPNEKGVPKLTIEELVELLHQHGVMDKEEI